MYTSETVYRGFKLRFWTHVFAGSFRKHSRGKTSVYATVRISIERIPPENARAWKNTKTGILFCGQINRVRRIYYTIARTSVIFFIFFRRLFLVSTGIICIILHTSRCRDFQTNRVAVAFEKRIEFDVSEEERTRNGNS